MPVSHRLSDGSELVLHIRCNTRRNIILRPHPAGGLHIGIPRWLGITELRRWLQEHEPLLRQTLARAPDSPKQPESIWLDGEQLALAGGSGVPAIRRDGSRLLLPDTADTRALLRGYLREQAPDLLFPLFAERLSSLKLPATPVRLSDARSFWGVCRPSGIGLNWRLAGAPAWVRDYVCVHELCHIRHPNHSRAFWQEVARHTPHTTAAKSWLKAHGRELFACG